MSRFQLILGLSLVCLVSGCGKKETGPANKPTVKVKGTITVNGQAPPWKIQLQAIPDGPPDPKNPTASFAETNEDGSFSFSTYALGDGVPEGSYSLLAKSQTVVIAFANGIEAPDKLAGKYDTAKESPKKFDVSGSGEDEIDLGTIDLKSNAKKK